MPGTHHGMGFQEQQMVVCLLQAAAEAPAALQPGDVGVLAQFLGGKLSDW